MIAVQPIVTPAVLAASLALAHPAAAEPARAARSAQLTAVVQDLGRDRGTLSTATLEIRAATPNGSWSLAPAVGRRSLGAGARTALGGTVSWQRNWSSRVATTSEAFLAEAHGPFAQASLAQSLTARAARSTAFTATLRWSHYQGGQDVWFVSGEARRYVRRGSLAYRLTWIKPADRAGYTSHLLSFTLNDQGGEGRTQLWLSQGQASLATATVADGFRGHDRALQLRRVQPLARGVALSLSGGLASYDFPGGGVRSRNLGLGLSLEF